MKLYKVLPIAFAAIMAFQPAVMAKDNGSVVVTPVAQDADAANGGVVYALPQTVIRVKLTARVIVESAGPFYQYSTRLLNLTDVVTQNAMRWSLVSAEVQTVGCADYSNRFKVSASDAALLPSISLSSEGVLSGVNACAPKESAEADLSAPALSYVNFAEVPLAQSVVSRTSKAAMAEDAAQSIFSLRAARVALLSGDVDARLPDAGSLALALERIDDLERQHVEMFAGRRDTVTVVKYVDVTPDYNGANSLVPIRFSETAGFVDALDLTGKPVYVDIEFSDKAKVNALPDNSKERKSSPLTGLRYYIPGCVSVRVLDRNILLCQTEVRCTQNGVIATLPASLLSTHSLLFDTATGAIKGMTLKSDNKN